MKDEIKIKKLKYKSSKMGTKELDLILGKFAQDSLDILSEEEINQYEALLNLTDPEIYDIILGWQPAPHWLNKELLKRINIHYLPL